VSISASLSAHSFASLSGSPLLSRRSNDWEVYTIRATGGGKFNVTNNGTDDYYPDYSPDGKKIAYAAWNTTDDEIYRINVGGGGKFQVTDNDAETDDIWPSYSPNGNKIVYTSYYGFDATETALYKINVGGGSEFQVTDNNGTGSLSPSWGSR
jgi:TolB protein